MSGNESLTTTLSFARQLTTFTDWGYVHVPLVLLPIGLLGGRGISETNS